ncbi:MAG: hypothetical protein JF606_11225 [Burkholderiales bacterium]|nr:hypothetical protein [Burkholderiales bacterium]
MNFANVNYARGRPLPIWFAPGTVMLLIAIAWGGFRYTHAQRVLADARSQLTEHRQALARQAATPVVSISPMSQERVKSINEAISTLNLPWPALLGAIETARPRDVALIRVEPHPKDKLVLVTAQADDMPTLIDFMRQVSRTAPFVKVLPVRQEVVLDSGLPHRQATFEARWEDRP